jgi:Fe-S cluster biogenesis protein NfuA
VAEFTQEQVEKVLDDFVRPVLHAEGGDLVVERITKDGKISVFLTGRCAGCPGADLTLDFLVTRFLKAKIPAVQSVTRVNWHLPREAPKENPEGEEEDEPEDTETPIDAKTDAD